VKSTIVNKSENGFGEW